MLELRRLGALIKRRLWRSQNPVLGQMTLSLKKARSLATGTHLTFVTFSELARWTREWEPALPPVDLIVAIPRSGLTVGSILALRRGLPLATPKEGPWMSHLMGLREIHRILLVDDSVRSGKAMAEAKAAIKQRYPNAHVETAALIASSSSKNLVDHFGVIIEWPRLFEWNFLHSKKLTTAFDFDGVLCENPEYGLANDDMRYRSWIASAKPLYIPNYEIDAIISNRPERVRAETEAWLAENGVRTRQLILAPAEAEESGRDKFRHKIRTLRELKPDLFIESESSTAQAVERATSIPVLSIEAWKLFN